MRCKKSTRTTSQNEPLNTENEELQEL